MVSDTPPQVSCNLAGCTGHCGICTPPPADRPVAGWRTMTDEEFERIAEAMSGRTMYPGREPLRDERLLREAKAQRAEVARLTDALAKPGKTLVGNEAGRYVAERLRDMAENNPEFRDGLLEIAGDLATVSAGSDEEIAYQKGRAEVTAQRDAALALAREAIWMLNDWDESITSYEQGTSDGTTAADLRAKLDAIATGGG